jgi:hypothetical protein
VLRDGLFSSDEFVAASKGYTLLRLTPGPAEARFGITVAPLTAVADWQGRVTVRRLPLRGNITAACRRLVEVERDFDRRAAAKPLHPIPDWATKLVAPEGSRAMAAFLGKVHPARGKAGRRGPSFDDLAKLYREVDRDFEKISLATNYIAGLSGRRTAGRKDVAAWKAESALLKEMSFCANDSVKFKAIDACGAFLPVGEIGFFADRAARRTEDCLNPNVVLCRSAGAVGKAASRLPADADDGERKAVLGALPFLTEILDREGRNNSACALARGSIEAIAQSTGSPRALKAYLHCFKDSRADTEWMRRFTDRFNEAAAKWLTGVTGQDLRTDRKAWEAWLGKTSRKLVFDRKRGVFRPGGGSRRNDD